MARYFTADLHLGETRIELMGRPFDDFYHNDNAIIVEINNVVGPQDELFILGDAVSKSALKPENSLRLLSYINGRKTLVRGNHDEQFSDDQLAPYFNLVVPHGQGLDVKIGEMDVHLTHYPTLGKSDRFNLVGHIHSAWRVQLNMLNVGVDANHFRPLTEKQIQFMYSAVCDFYDDDVWVAYAEQNSQYQDTRGKLGSYFKPEESIAFPEVDWAKLGETIKRHNPKCVSIQDSPQDNLSASIDFDVEPETDRFVSLLYTPLMCDTNNHYHIKLADQSVEKLYEYLGQYLMEKELI